MLNSDLDDYLAEISKHTNKVLTKLYGGQPIDSCGRLASEITGWIKSIYGPDVEIGNFRTITNEDGQLEYKVDVRVMPSTPIEVLIEITKCLEGAADEYDL